MVNLDKEIQFIKGVGPNRAKALNKLIGRIDYDNKNHK